MSNSWFYTLLVPRPGSLTETAVEALLGVAEHQGFAAVNPRTGRLMGMESSGEAEYAFERRDQVVTLLSSAGGLLTLWKNDVGINLTFPPPTTSPFSSGSSQVTIFVEGTYFTSKTARLGGHRKEVARIIDRLFASFAAQTEAWYGYSADEVTLDSFRRVPGMVKDEITRQPPPVLWWLQYFATAYAANLDLALLRTLGAAIRPIRQGILASFYDYPWEANAAQLEALSAVWRTKIHQP